MTTTTARPTATPVPDGPRQATRTTFRGLAYDTFDARAAATFWAAALRVQVAPGASVRHAELLDDAVAGLPHLVFRQVTGGRRLSTPVHLVLATDDVDAEVRRLQALGARRLGAISAEGRRWVTLADPEGNEFDLVAA